MAHQVQPAAHRAHRIARCRRDDIVETAAAARGLTKSPLLVLDRVRAFLDEHDLGAGDIAARRIGEGGGSNFTFLLERGRRPVRAPAPSPSTASALGARRRARGEAPARAARGRILAPSDDRRGGEDETILGVPFYVMTYLEGHVMTDELVPGLEGEPVRRRLVEDLVESLVEIHRADVTTPGLAAFARPGSYSERQVRRFTQLWGINKTREIPAVERVGEWLADNVPVAAARDGRARRLSPREHDGRAATSRRGSSPCSTGRWELSETRAPISATCWRCTASRAVLRARSARRR